MTPPEVDLCTVKQVAILHGYDEAPPEVPTRYERPEHVPTRAEGDRKPRLRRVV